MYANANNGSSNSNTNNGVRLAIKYNRLYGVTSRDGVCLWPRIPSLGKSIQKWVESGKTDGATYNRRVEKSEITTVAEMKEYSNE